MRRPDRDTTRRPRWASHTTVALLALVGFMALMGVARMTGQTPYCRAVASHDLAEYCYRTQLSFKSSTSTTYLRYPLGFAIAGPGMISGNLLGTNGLDLVVVDSSNAERPVMLQDIETGAPASSTWWLFGDLIPNATINYQLYTGDIPRCPAAGCVFPYRDQGLRFSSACGGLTSCNDVVTVPDHNDLDFTDDFEIIVKIETPDADQTGGIVSKMSGGNNGYRLGLNTTSTGMLFWEVGGGPTRRLEVAYDGTRQWVRAVFNASAPNDMTIYTSTATSTTPTWAVAGEGDSGFESIGTNVTSITIGDGFDGEIFEVYLNDNIDGVIRRVATYGFNGIDIAQTTPGSASNDWTWSGTVDDLHGGTHHAAYALRRDQSFLASLVAPTAYNYADPVVATTPTARDVMGAAGDSNFAEISATPTWRHLGVFGDAFDTARSGSELGAQAFGYVMVLIAALLIAGVGFYVTKSEPVFFVLVVVVFGVGAAVEVVNEWYAVISGIVVFSLWLLTAKKGAATA